ncbi:UNVERIFIED_CONTAM: hypothetical protein GTU68_021578 [Idotea baltica]|nr:hypothetical protein [Idotea baltica]
MSASDGSSYYVKRQLVFAGLGTVAMLVVAQIPPSLMRRWIALVYLFGVFLLVAVIFFGSGAKGAQRWIDLGFVTFQPSEIIKLTLPIAMAAYLCTGPLPPSFGRVIFSLILMLTPMALVLRQPDLGTSLLIAASGFVVLFLAGLKWRYLLSAFILGLITVPLLWIYAMHDYQRQRVLTMFNPEADKLGAGWNIIQSKTAIGSGGWSGKGWHGGTQSHLDFLPEGHTDFIIAVLAEEFGMRGVLILLFFYALFAIRGFWISLSAKSAFGRMLAGAITFTLFVYVFVNMGMVSGILPVVGVPLPLVSYGGTSLISLFMGFGVLMAVATEKQKLADK